MAVLDAPKSKEKTKEHLDKGWQTVVWDDPINTMTYVVFVFQTVFGMNETDAHKRMMEVHTKGKSIVFSGSKEKCEHYTHEIQSYSLKATLEKIS